MFRPLFWRVAGPRSRIPLEQVFSGRRCEHLQGPQSRDLLVRMGRLTPVRSFCHVVSLRRDRLLPVHLCCGRAGILPSDWEGRARRSTSNGPPFGGWEISGRAEARPFDPEGFPPCLHLEGISSFRSASLGGTVPPRRHILRTARRASLRLGRGWEISGRAQARPFDEKGGARPLTSTGQCPSRSAHACSSRTILPWRAIFVRGSP